MTVDHQGNVMFLTFFIQKADGSPYWVTGQLTRTTPGNAITTPVSFTGDVYETRGTYYGQPWNPSLVANRKVGTATFLATSLNAASVTYYIDGVNVQRQLERQTLQFVSLQGSYYGRIYQVTSNCNPATLNNDVTDAKGNLTITQNGSNIGMLFQGPGSCQYTGTYGQSGKLGNVSGTLACTNEGGASFSGTFTMSAVQWTVYGMTAGLTGKIAAGGQSCDISGVIGGVTTGHFGP